VTAEQLPLAVTEDAAEEFTAALGQVLAGGLRLAEWGQDNGIPAALGISGSEWAQKKLKGYVHWDDDERRLVVKHLTEQLGLSTRKAAAIIGVSHDTVARDLRAVRNLTAPPEPPPGEDAEAVRNLTPPPAPVPMAEPAACARCGAPTSRLWVNAGEAFTGQVLCSACASALDARPEHVHVGANSGENEWYTPAAYLEAARAVLGDIDLDPASTAVANEVVKASVFYDAAKDGLAYEWYGRVWLNPPYAQPLCARFCGHLLKELEAERVRAACVLVNNATETEWFQALGRGATAVCFPNGRVRFWHPDRAEGAPLQGQALLYFGEEEGAFREQFGRFGLVLGAGDA
jgi:ParB family chromosome partitioning protein